MGNEGSERLIKTEDSEGGLETEPGFLRPRSGLELQAPLFFKSPRQPLPLSASQSDGITKLLLNSSVIPSTIEPLCTAPGSKGLAPSVVIHPHSESSAFHVPLQIRPTCLNSGEDQAL